MGRLAEAAFSPRTLERAWHSVLTNDRRDGIVGAGVARFEADWEDRLTRHRLDRSRQRAGLGLPGAWPARLLGAHLGATGGVDGQCQAQILAAFAFAQFDGAGIKLRVELGGNMGHCMNKTIDALTHDLDREIAGIDDQRRWLGIRCGRGGVGGHIGVGGEVCNFSSKLSPHIMSGLTEITGL